ncbi:MULTISPECIES: type II toxin-antitoxin system ParD family antitoxin [unclassified Sulfitobacter]|jgi:antitoxin ParD1/3/4|uniref:type II toxin-antitoxin system ParD family antitoxin n=1 Tax=unclassified Sulfitobacter TaxID=196795 RepID=UPI0037458B7C|tara:strand:- start:1381 stop:1539 length:159 start_codon:yes stop_codon:yes gene_type:complete
MTERISQPPVDQAAMEALHAALVEGEQSGKPQPFNFEEFKFRKRAELGLPNT